MKQILFIFLMVPLAIGAQQSGKIVYAQTVQTNFTPPEGMPKEMLDRIPKERKMVKELYFDGQESYYKTGEVERSEDAEFEGGGRRFRMRFGGGNADEQSYKNLTESVAVDKENLMGKDFIIEGSIPAYAWKITGKKKQILEYLAMEATTTIRDTVPVTAWFTPQIPVQNGPGIFGGLPGMILEIDQDEGDNVITATLVELGELDSEMIKKPTKGKKVTREEFQAIRKEKMEEMRAQRGAGGGRRIIVRG